MVKEFPPRIIQTCLFVFLAGSGAGRMIADGFDWWSLAILLMGLGAAWLKEHGSPIPD